MLWLIRRLLRLAEREPTPEELRPRLQEVAGWLRHPVGLKEVLDEMTWWCNSEKEVRSVRGGLERWLREHMAEGDVLWRYDSGSDSWEHLAGECGVAVVREGEVVRCLMIAMN